MASKYPYAKLSNKPSDSTFDYSSAFEYSSFSKNNVAHNRNEYKSAFTYRSVSSSEEIFSDCHKEPWPSIFVRHTIFYVSCLFALLLFPISVFLCVKGVHSLERLVVFRLGKMQPVKGPGFILVLPFVDHWTRVDLHPKQLIVSTPQILTVDGGVVEVTAEINYQVSDVLHYVTKSSNQFKSVQDLGTCCLVNIVAGKDQEELEKNREIISETLKGELNNTIVKWGIEIVSISLKHVKILKAGEPINAASTLMAALKAIVQPSSFNPICANMMKKTPENVSALESEESKCVKLENTKEPFHIISVLRHFASSVVNKERIKDISAIFKVEIIGSTPNIAYINVCDGNISILENIELEQNPDISVVLTEDVLQDILDGKINALEAYLSGKITVSGNWALLNTLSELLN